MICERKIFMDRYKEVIDYYKDKLNTINKIDDLQIRKLVVVSMIDSLAQEYYNYKGNNKKIFRDFVLKFTKNYSFLNDVDVVTLYYKNKEIFNQSNYNLDFLEDGNNYSAIQVIEMIETRNMINFACNKQIDIDKHKYINLIYKCRSKLTHEFLDIGSHLKFLENNETINYLSYSKFNSEDVEWKISIPYSFLEKLFIECLNGYIYYCKNKKIDPFENSKEYMHWYE